MNRLLRISPLGLLLLAAGCTPPPRASVTIPAEEYARQFRSGPAFQASAAAATPSRAQLRFVDGPAAERTEAAGADTPGPDIVSNENPEFPGVNMYRASANLTRDYQGPLELGDPGVAASLWKESRSSNDILRDDRAWEAGDLLTIIVSESDQGSRQAKTDSKSETTLAAALGHFLGLSELFDESRATVDTNNLIEGSSKFEFKGEGKTDRKNSLTAKISAMVAEVLPTGILRIEGKKIVVVNDEEQIMKISGLVRTRDLNSANEIDSSKIANMRIDYYGKGTVDEASSPGWGTRILSNVWPF